MSSKIKGNKFSVIIARGFGLILIFTLLLGMVNIVALQKSSDAYEELLDNAVQLDILSITIENELLGARRSEKDFIARNDAGKLVTLEDHISNIINVTNQLLKLKIPQMEKDYAKSVLLLIDLYHAKSKDVFKNYVSRGGGVFGPDNGLVGAMREAIHDFEENIQSDYKNGEFNDTMYYYFEYYYNALRKDEKDYLLRSDIKYYNQALDKISIMKTNFSEILDNVTKQNYYISTLDLYKEKLDDVINMDGEIISEIAIFTKAAHEVEVIVDTMKSTAREIKEDALAELERSIKEIKILTIMILLIIVSLSVFLIILLTRSITKPVLNLNREVAFIAKGDLTQEVSSATSNTLELNELSNDVHQMKTSLRGLIKSIAESNHILNVTSEDLYSGSEEINASAEEVASTSQAMSDGATSQTELIAEVNENIIDMQSIVEDIVKKIQLNTQEVSQIALQTNILALNAGIEASRAGDYGRGFAVVAENVRKLSDQSKMASERINSVADEIRDTLQSSFNRISNTMINVVSVSEETAASAEEVAAAAEEMTATIEELSSAAEELTSQAAQSRELIEKFVYE